MFIIIIIIKHNKLKLPWSKVQGRVTKEYILNDCEVEQFQFQLKFQLREIKLYPSVCWVRSCDCSTRLLLLLLMITAGRMVKMISIVSTVKHLTWLLRCEAWRHRHLAASCLVVTTRHLASERARRHLTTEVLNSRRDNNWQQSSSSSSSSSVALSSQSVAESRHGDTTSSSCWHASLSPDIHSLITDVHTWSHS